MDHVPPSDPVTKQRRIGGMLYAMTNDPTPPSPDNVVTLDTAAPDAGERERAAETALLLRVRDHGDRTAFNEFFDRFCPRLRAYAQKQGAAPQVAENVVQDVMITAWTRAHLFDPDKASARTWIYTLVRNRLIDAHRAGERRQRAYDKLATNVAVVEDTPDEPEHGLGNTKLLSMLEELPEEQTRAVLMAYVEGKSHREIAEELGVPTGTIKSRTRLALQRLRKMMEIGE
jgi:RNA polymerase sigma-70 factor (ECF subfamily)